MIVVGDVKGVVHFLSRDDGSFVARLNDRWQPDPGAAATPRVAVCWRRPSKGSVLAIETQ
jgi:hypothetical protein